MYEKNSTNITIRMSDRIKDFIDKRAKKHGGIKKYHLHLYEEDGLEISTKDL